jgi:hypothetical protein
MNTAMSTDPKKTPPATTVTKSQAYTLAKAQNLGGGKGFAAFVPSWIDAPQGTDPGEWAAKLLDAAGADRMSASAAIDFIFGSRPSTVAGKVHRGLKGIALLLKQPVPVAPIEAKPAQSEKPSAGPIDMAEIELAMAQVRLAEAKLRALRAR